MSNNEIPNPESANNFENGPNGPVSIETPEEGKFLQALNTVVACREKVDGGEDQLSNEDINAARSGSVEAMRKVTNFLDQQITQAADGVDVDRLSEAKVDIETWINQMNRVADSEAYSGVGDESFEAQPPVPEALDGNPSSETSEQTGAETPNNNSEEEFGADVQSVKDNLTVLAGRFGTNVAAFIGGAEVESMSPQQLQAMAKLCENANGRLGNGDDSQTVFEDTQRIAQRILNGVGV